MVTSRSVPQHTEQILWVFAGQYRFAFRFWQMGQVIAFDRYRSS
jgi:hypothetical protein